MLDHIIKARTGLSYDKEANALQKEKTMDQS